MINIVYKNNVHTINELSDMSGIPTATLRDRLRRGYTIEEAMSPHPIFNSVKQFCDESWYEDWIDTSTTQLYNVYWEWCIRNEYTPIHCKGFTRQVMKLYPNLKVIPMKDRDGKYHRMIRLK